MTSRPNPLRLNPLQLRTLALLQALAADRNYADAPDAEGAVVIRGLPRAHGDHFHIGDAIVRSADATGLFNGAVYAVLARKGLVLGGPAGMPILTAAGRGYATGLDRQVLHRADH